MPYVLTTERDLAEVLAMLVRLSNEAGLTPALERCLIDLGLGLSNQDIASKHGITVNTVKTEVKTLYRELDLDCRHEISRAVRRAQLRLQGGARVEHVEAILRVGFERL